MICVDLFAGAPPCEACGRLFEHVVDWQRYCSKGCQNAGRRKGTHIPAGRLVAETWLDSVAPDMPWADMAGQCRACHTAGNVRTRDPEKTRSTRRASAAKRRAEEPERARAAERSRPRRAGERAMRMRDEGRALLGEGDSDAG